MKKKILLISICLICLVLLAILIPFIVLNVKTTNIKVDYEYLKLDENYKDEVKVEDINLVNQKISCGYACIEMVSSFYGSIVSEDDLDSKNKSISTSSSNGFLKEINASIPNKEFVMHSYLKNDELLKEIYNSLKKGNPVVIEWAAKYEEKWTLHFSVVSGLDINKDKVTIYNPYGFVEEICLGEFISRMSFSAYQKMPLFLKFGFLFGAFRKNTIFYAL